MWPALATNVLNLRIRVDELDENIGSLDASVAVQSGTGKTMVLRYSRLILDKRLSEREETREHPPA
jgi:hypothetical protein